LKPKNLEGVTVVLQLTQVKEDALSQVSQVSNTYPTMNVETVVVLFAIAAIFGLVGILAVNIMMNIDIKSAAAWHSTFASKKECTNFFKASGNTTSQAQLICNKVIPH
jgi:hypothetical protein